MDLMERGRRLVKGKPTERRTSVHKATSNLVHGAGDFVSRAVPYAAARPREVHTAKPPPLVPAAELPRIIDQCNLPAAPSKVLSDDWVGLPASTLAVAHHQRGKSEVPVNGHNLLFVRFDKLLLTESAAKAKALTDLGILVASLRDATRLLPTILAASVAGKRVIRWQERVHALREAIAKGGAGPTPAAVHMLLSHLEVGLRSVPVPYAEKGKELLLAGAKLAVGVAMTQFPLTASMGTSNIKKGASELCDVTLASLRGAIARGFYRPLAELSVLTCRLVTSGCSGEAVERAVVAVGRVVFQEQTAGRKGALRQLIRRLSPSEQWELKAAYAHLLMEVCVRRPDLDEATVRRLCIGDADGRLSVLAGGDADAAGDVDAAGASSWALCGLLRYGEPPVAPGASPGFEERLSGDGLACHGLDEWARGALGVLEKGGLSGWIDDGVERLRNSIERLMLKETISQDEHHAHAQQKLDSLVSVMLKETISEDEHEERRRLCRDLSELLSAGELSADVGVALRDALPSLLAQATGVEQAVQSVLGEAGQVAGSSIVLVSHATSVLNAFLACGHPLNARKPERDRVLHVLAKASDASHNECGAEWVAWYKRGYAAPPHPTPSQRPLSTLHPARPL